MVVYVTTCLATQIDTPGPALWLSPLSPRASSAALALLSPVALAAHRSRPPRCEIGALLVASRSVGTMEGPKAMPSAHVAELIRSRVVESSEARHRVGVW